MTSEDRHARLILLMRENRLKSGADLTRATGIPDSTARAYVNGTRPLTRDACEIIAKELGGSARWLFSGEPEGDELSQARPRERQVGRPTHSIRILGKVAAGNWLNTAVAAQNASKGPLSPLPADPRYPVAAQFDLMVEGSSINRFAQDGQYLRCVDLMGGGVEVEEGDLVIVVQYKDAELCETTAKRVRKKNGDYELWPDSDDPLWQKPITVKRGGEHTDGEVKITALVLYAYTPARRPA